MPEIRIFCELPRNPTLKPITNSINHSFLPLTEGQPLIGPGLNASSAMFGEKTSVFNFLLMPINDALNRRLYRQVKSNHSQSGIIKDGGRISSTWTSKNSNPPKGSKCSPKCPWKIQQTSVSWRLWGKQSNRISTISIDLNSSSERTERTVSDQTSVMST